MKRMVIAGVAAALAAGGTGVWWMAGNRAEPAAAPAATETPAAAADAGPAMGATILSEAGPAPVAADAVAPAPAIAPDDTVSIERGYCFGPCPVYKATAFGDDRLVFEGRKFVVADGVREKRLEAGGFARLLDIARRHDIMSMDTNWPDEAGLNCPEPPTDLPTVSVTVDAAELARTVKFYEGCAGAPGADRVKAMVAELDKALALDDWIGPRERFYGKRDKP